MALTFVITPLAWSYPLPLASPLLTSPQSSALLQSLQDHLSDRLGNPDLFYLLLIAGLLGIALEILHPATFIPGIIGGILLGLALIAGTVLPINYGAVGLILIATAFMLAEVFLPALGILGLAGLVGFIKGSLMVIDEPNAQGLSLSPYTIVPIGLVMALVSVTVGYLLMKSRKAHVPTSEEAFLKETAVAVEDFRSGQGLVRIEGELWKAEVIDDAAIKRGDKIIVVVRAGLKLTVRPFRS